MTKASGLKRSWVIVHEKFYVWMGGWSSALREMVVAPFSSGAAALAEREGQHHRQHQ